MAEENQERQIPQEQVVPETRIFPPSTAPKTTWLEVVGLPAEEAGRKIKEEMPRAQIEVVPPNCSVTMDYNTQRVRLYVNSVGKVIRTPRIG